MKLFAERRVAKIEVGGQHDEFGFAPEQESGQAPQFRFVAVPRFEPDGRGVVGLGLVASALLRVGVAAGVKGFRVAGVEADGLRGVGDGLVKLAPARVGPGPVGVGGGEAGIGPDGLGAVGDSLVKLALLPIGAAAVQVGEEIPGLSRIASVKSAMALSRSPLFM